VCSSLACSPLLFLCLLKVDPCVVFISAVKGGGDAMARSPPRVGSVLPHTHCTDCPTLARGSSRARVPWAGAQLPCFACHAPPFFSCHLTHAQIWHRITPAKRSRVSGKTALITMPFGYRADDVFAFISPCAMAVLVLVRGSHGHYVGRRLRLDLLSSVTSSFLF
jgi:hypothetical protein